ncbi:hypothetical protein CYMTET_15779 [Cymbomonas tetramitiformis]|uniref:Uncharacterized protein n=1 Tax=Cymbomonas tetramitiformis TaxID=36881 RepID=A0AAE0GDF1_9CHLO|nr:hypothetical protein CYMTET_15779 [Cymbomonas tetramitiformis]
METGSEVESVVLPATTGVMGISLWTWIQSQGQPELVYLVDTNGEFISSKISHPNWERMFVDGTSVPMDNAWRSIPKDLWVHLLLERATNESIIDTTTVFSRHSRSSSETAVRGSIAEIYLWSRVLTSEEIAMVSSGAGHETLGQAICPPPSPSPPPLTPRYRHIPHRPPPPSRPSLLHSASPPVPHPPHPSSFAPSFSASPIPPPPPPAA